MHCDGTWGTAGTGVSAILTPPFGPRLRYVARLQFTSTNNTAEYEVVLLGLQKLGVRRYVVRSDS